MAMSVNPAEPRPRYKPYPKCKDSGVEWLGEIPAHWEVMQLGQTIETILDFRGRTPLKLGMDWGGDIPAISAANVRDGYLDLSRGINYGSQALHDRWMSQGPTRLGDIVFTTEAPLGNVALLPDNEQYILSQRVVLLRPSRDRIRSEYLRYFLSSAPFRQGLESQATGSTAEGVKRRYLVALPACVPEIDEQIAVAALLDRETARIDGLVAKKERLIELLQEKRSALITRAVTKGLDPNVPMKDSGVEWLGEIPAHWDVKRLWHLTPRDRRIMYGIVLPGPSVDDGVPIVKGGDISPERLRLDRLNRTTREIESGYVRSRLQGGDLVYAIRGSIGEVAVVPNELEGANLTQDAARIAYTAATHGPWLLHALKSAAVFAQLEVGALGATIRGVNIRDLKRASIPVPPRAEQEAIANFLERGIGSIDALISKIRTAIDRLRELRTALISAAVTGKIDVRQESP